MDAPVTLAYDALGLRTVVQDAHGRTTFSYDALGRTTAMVDFAGRRMTYSYDAAGQRTRLVAPGDGRFTTSYDAAGRLVRLVNSQGRITTFQYDAAGRRSVTRLASGIRTSHSYDAADRVTQLAHVGSDGSFTGRFGYQYDAAGQRTGLVELDGSRTTWSYDASGQLVAEQRTGTAPVISTFTYDAPGNRIKAERDGGLVRFDYDAANQLLCQKAASGRTTFVFDGAGNQQVALAPDLSRTTTVWDAENRSTVHQAADGTRVTFSYNPDGRRLSKETASLKTQFVWEPVSDGTLQERDDFDALLAEYTTKPAQFGPVLSQNRGGTTSDLLTDALGSTRLVTDTSGAITDAFVYDAWGVELLHSGGLLLPFRWVGRWGYYFDPETNLVYVRARTYQPMIAWWLSVDPRDSRTLLYGYADNVPIWLVDMTGGQAVPVPVRPAPVQPTRPPLRIWPEPKDPPPEPWPGPMPGRDVPRWGEPKYPFPDPLDVPRLPPGPCDKPRITPLPGTQAYQQYVQKEWEDFLNSCENKYGYPPCPKPPLNAHRVANDFLQREISLPLNQRRSGWDFHSNATYTAENCREQPVRDPNINRAVAAIV